ncbi:hypothetical protein [Natrinema salifodinae]|uniref:DUF4129 domain-containing protein n=1 Tax=Natrinema salifodinae TaxID=1202768 RepID=A0A1I0M671_9EURY|nr:hypothetical protein [Natrinema salifodinae]SEV83843.1 hypothetical protein SAMN05216285_0539 [Natrinema salifodinae]
MTDAQLRALVRVVLVAAVLGGAVAPAATAATAPPADTTVERVALQDTGSPDAAADGNETARHRNPDTYAEDGDVEAVEAWLTDRMAAQLRDGAIDLQEGDYDRAAESIDEEYHDRLLQYAEISDDDAAEFEEAGDRQEALTAAVREYWETKSEYEAAREAGDDERARELARDLERTAEEIEESSGSIRGTYDEIEAETDANLSESDAAIENVTEEVRAEQTVVREQEFEPTVLTLAPERSDISFREPLVAAGELRTADGEPIANEEIALEIGNHTERVATDSAGGFTLEYRPTDEPLSTDELEVRYVPATQSTYLGDETNVSVSIDQVEPTVSLDESAASDEIAYGEEAAVSGDLTVDGVPVDGVPLAVTVDGQRIGSVNATAGTFDGTAPVPADVEDGDRDLGAQLPFEDRALASASDATTVTVRETESDLSLDATPAATDDREITVNGTLAAGTDGTGDGDGDGSGGGIAGEPVELRIDGTIVGTVTTAADGTFGDTVAVPNSVDGGDVTVAAVYDGSGSNLEPARTETVATIGEAGPLSLAPAQAWLAGGVALLLAIGLGAWWYRRSTASDPAPVGPPGDRGDAVSGRSDEDAIADEIAVEPLFERARLHLSNGRPDTAARVGYAAARRALASRVEDRRALTHWEFYRRYRNADETTADLLRDVTEGYERATFGRRDVSTDEATGVLEKARRLCGIDDESGHGSDSADE